MITCQFKCLSQVITEHLCQAAFEMFLGNWSIREITSVRDVSMTTNPYVVRQLNGPLVEVMNGIYSFCYMLDLGTYNLNFFCHFSTFQNAALAVEIRLSGRNWLTCLIQLIAWLLIFHKRDSRCPISTHLAISNVDIRIGQIIDIRSGSVV